MIKNYDVKITYLYNSGFTVETVKHLLLFDYYRDHVNKKDLKKADNTTSKRLLQTEKKVLTFASHSHGDHFNPVILEWMDQRADIRYVLSNEIKPGRMDERIKMMAPYEDLKIDDVAIKSYGSTDLGVSFLVRVDGLSIFHAGDLNWWRWWDDTEEEMKVAERWFKEEIERIKGEKIDIAFFPVDPRLEHNYGVGGKYFIERIQPAAFIPMHFGADYEITDKFADLMKEADTRVIKISNRGQEILL